MQDAGSSGSATALGHALAGIETDNSTSGFVQTHGIGICKGGYAPALLSEWHTWDQQYGSENDPVDCFHEDQLYVVYVVADGGTDLEKFQPRSFTEARSILLQVELCLF